MSKEFIQRPKILHWHSVAILALLVFFYVAMGTVCKSKLNSKLDSSAVDLLDLPGKDKVALANGAAGFIGSHVVKYCATVLHMKVIAVDDLSGGFMSNVPMHQNVVFVRGDVKDALFLEKLFKDYKIDYVYHLAAYAAEGLSHFIHSCNYLNNLAGSVELLNAAVKAKIDCFVFTSSIAVYGAGQTPMTEAMKPEPEDPYGIAKYAMELNLRAAKHMWDLDFIIFRPHNVYGPHQNLFDRYRNVIGIFMNQILAGKPLTIFGDGQQTRAFSYIDDVAPYIAMGPLIKRARNEVFNIGADEPYSLNTLAKEVSLAMSATLNVVYLDAHKEVVHAESDHSKLRCFFPVKTPVNLRTGLTQMVDWVEKQGHFFSPIEFDAVEVLKSMPPSWVTPKMVEKPSIIHSGPTDASDVRLSKLGASQTNSKIFYFGVTHESTIERAIASDAAWGWRVMPDGLPWYSTKADAILKNLTVINPDLGSTSHSDLSVSAANR